MIDLATQKLPTIHSTKHIVETKPCLYKPAFHVNILFYFYF